MAPADALALPRVLEYHPHARDRAAVRAVRVQRRHVSFGLPVIVTGGNRKLAKVIRELRGEMTQERLAKLASRGGPPKVTRSYIALLETGRKRNPSVPILRKLARALGVPVGELLE